MYARDSGVEKHEGAKEIIGCKIVWVNLGVQEMGYCLSFGGCIHGFLGCFWQISKRHESLQSQSGEWKLMRTSSAQVLHKVTHDHVIRIHLSALSLWNNPVHRRPIASRVILMTTELPYEIWVHILSFLDTETIRQLRFINTLLYNLSLDDYYRITQIGYPTLFADNAPLWCVNSGR